MLNATELLEIAAAGNLAPSVHNTQPTRWSLAKDGGLLLKADLRRQLAVGDAAGRDIRVSLGAALEATILALGMRGIAARGIDLDDASASARAQLDDGGSADPLAEQMTRRVTWRRRFAPVPTAETRALEAWAAAQADITLVAAPADVEIVSALNERTSLAFYRNAPYRRELVSWMRLSPADPRFGVDGLSAPAMGMSRVEALGAGFVLSDPGFAVLDRIGVVGPLISERSRTSSAAAILLFHRPMSESPTMTGRALYRRQLELSALGFQTWPMSVLADDAEAARELSTRFHLADDRRLITAWRAGALPAGAMVRRERLPAEALVTA